MSCLLHHGTYNTYLQISEDNACWMSLFFCLKFECFRATILNFYYEPTFSNNILFFPDVSLILSLPHDTPATQPDMTRSHISLLLNSFMHKELQHTVTTEQIEYRLLQSAFWFLFIRSLVRDTTYLLRGPRH